LRGFSVLGGGVVMARERSGTIAQARARRIYIDSA
jgi:hypothetical protein